MTDWTYKLYAIMSAEAVAASAGNRGKLIAQGGHAYVGALLDAQLHWPRSVHEYLYGQDGFVKICLIAPEETLLELNGTYQRIGGAALITDAAHTVFDKPTITALGLGPIRVDLIGDDLKSLKVFI